MEIDKKSISFDVTYMDRELYADNSGWLYNSGAHMGVFFLSPLCLLVAGSADNTSDRNFQVVNYLVFRR